MVQPGDGITVVSWGEMLHRCLEAAQPFESRIEIIDLRTIIPWDKEAVLTSVRNTGKCLIAHEDGLTGGFGAEIAATLAQECFLFLDAPIQRVAVPDTPIPFNISLMNMLIPSIELLRSRMEDLLRW
jgi:2-oxoisovalerate dehydrogenase E1 component